MPEGPQKPGEGAFREPLIDSEFHRTNPFVTDEYLFTLRTNPNLLIRKGAKTPPEQSSEIADLHEQYTKGLIRLDEKYGIHSPGISVSREVCPDGDMQWYIVANRVNGIPFADALSEVPRDVAFDTFDKILDYYSDMASKTGIYIKDVTLRQMVYGTQGSDTIPKVYMVDLEPESSADFDGSANDSAMLRHAADWLDRMMWRNISMLSEAYNLPSGSQQINEWIDRTKAIEKSLEERAANLSRGQTDDSTTRS